MSPSNSNPDYIVFGRPEILEEDIAEVAATLRSGWIGTGPRTAAFEQRFSSYLGGGHTVAVASCTAALQLAVKLLELGPGDEVIIPAITFAADANVVAHAGATPVFCDVDARTLCVDIDDARARVTPRTRAIVAVHFAGRSCEIDRLLELARAHALVLIEDCAHAIETLYHGRHTGLFGSFGAFSFYVTKNITTVEGGMLIADDPTNAERAKTLVLHGLSADAWRRYSDGGFRHYDVVEPGFKANMTDVEATLGLCQLARVEASLARRQAIWQQYDAAFADLPLVLPLQEDPATRHARHLYTPLLDVDSTPFGRDDLLAALHERGIGTGVHYRGLHLHAYYRDCFGYRPDDLPSASWVSDRIFSLPLSPALSDAQVERVIAAVRGLLATQKPAAVPASPASSAPRSVVRSR